MPAINDKTCDTCQSFDNVLRGVASKGGLRETNWGWCAKYSTYPAKEGPGQRFPLGVTRAAEGEPSIPVIVKKGQVVPNCDSYTPRGNAPSKADLLKQLQAKANNVIIGN
jgi:hypothetical protein